MRTGRLIILTVVGLLLVAAVPSLAKDNWFDYDVYGYFKLDGARDQSQTNNGNYVMWVENEDDEQFNMTANQSRIGFKAFSDHYGNTHIGGNLEIDLYGGGAENKPLLLIRHAYLWVKSGGTKLVAGQTWDIVSPLNPSTLNYSVLWGCGNIGYRRPQVSLKQSFNPDNPTNFNVQIGMSRTIGDELSITLADGDDDGQDSGIPGFQGGFEVAHKFRSGAEFRTGVTGMWERLKSELSGSDNYENYDAWAANYHIIYSAPSSWGISAEAYYGQNLKQYNGGIRNESSIDGVTSYGGWASAWFKATESWKLGTGFGYDDPKNEDLGIGARSRNLCGYGNVQYFIVPQASVGLELSYWQTQYQGSGSTSTDVNNLRVQSSFMLTF
ncbi:MAG: hypothetical protein GF307_02735 [candidate division Zixibacteria bacterium]|nr:hypothetical protein [candidate division Zixibacteria bacterium]